MRLWLYPLVLALPACSQISFLSKPLSPASNVQAIAQAQPDQEGFKQYLTQQAPQLGWPIKQWDLQALTLSAMYFHPSLKVAKADYAVALAGITAAGLRPQVGLNGLLSRSNRANGDINPFLYNLQFDIPVITNGKREINIDIARHQADIAKIQLGETAWQLRHQLSTDLLDRAELLRMQANWQQLHDAQTALLKAYQKRLDAGLAGKVDVLPIQLQSEQTQWQWAQSKGQLAQISQKIVHDAGLTGQAIAPEQLAVPDLSQLLTRVITPAMAQTDSPLRSKANLQSVAMTNRMDIQRGLAQYAQAEARLKLEIAKLKPDISINPGIAYEFGDRIWSLGIGGLLNLLNRSSDMWKQADAVRQNEATRFYALQQQVVQQSEQAFVKFQQAYQLLQTLENEAQQQPQRLSRLQQQWRAGLIDKTEWLQSQIQFYTLQQRLISQQVSVLRAALEIENTMQVPFLFSAATLPTRSQMTGETQ